MKWILFKDEVPKCKCVYGTNFKEVWVMDDENNSWERYAKNHSEIAWSPIDIPEVPKKLHMCKNNNKDSYLHSCYEVEGSLNISMREYAASQSFIITEVNFCPFCGYKHEEIK